MAFPLKPAVSFDCSCPSICWVLGSASDPAGCLGIADADADAAAGGGVVVVSSVIAGQS